MNLDAKTFALAGLVVAGPTLLNASKLGRRAGVANRAAVAALAAELGFEAPDNASMVDAHAAMVRALGTADHLAFWIEIELAWLRAYRAGATADVVNYSLFDPGPDSGAFQGVSLDDIDFVCSDVEGWGPAVTPLGRAVCALHKLKLAPIDEDARRAAVLAATLEVAKAMDAADFVADGGRRTDRIKFLSLGEIPGKLAGALAGVVGDVAFGFLSSPAGLVLVAGAGFVVWRVLR